MSTVQGYLDCGCAILYGGGREWCPTCLAGPAFTPRATLPTLRTHYDLACSWWRIANREEANDPQTDSWMQISDWCFAAGHALRVAMGRRGENRQAVEASEDFTFLHAIALTRYDMTKATPRDTKTRDLFQEASA